MQAGAGAGAGVGAGEGAIEGAEAGAGAGAGPEAIRNETGDRLTNPLPNTTGAAVRLCNAVKGYPDVPRYCTQLRAVRSI